LSDEDVERIARATERAVFRATLRALGLIALVGLSLWLAFWLLAVALAVLTPAPGRGGGLETWLLLAAVAIAIAAGGYYLFRTLRAALR
jgi:hypothetical protein